MNDKWKTPEIKGLKSIVDALLIVIFALAAVTSHAQATDPDEIQRPGERDFRRGHHGPRGNEDSDPVSGVAMGSPTYGGTGCPQGTMTSVLSSDGTTIAIMFDRFAVRAGLNQGRRTQLQCTLRIPIQVPEGYRVEATRLDYRGFVNLPRPNSKAVLRSTFELLDGRGRPEGRVQNRAVYKGVMSDMYEISADVPFRRARGCGEAVTLSITNEAIAKSPNGEDTMITVDTIDSQTDAIKYYLRWKRCDSHGERPGRGDKNGPRERPGRGDRIERRGPSPAVEFNEK